MISVIIPIYNVEKDLFRCLQSIKNQSYSDFEVLMINDGSTDNSEDIAKQFITDSRFRLISKVNGGVAQARNVGLDNSKGEFICFVDSDDFVESNYLKELYLAIISNDADIAQCSVIRVTEDGKSQLYDYTGTSNEIILDIKSYLKKSSFVLWNKLFRKNLFDNLRFPEGMTYEDFALSPQVYNRAKKIVSIDKPLYNYYWRNNSITNKKDIHRDILKAQQILEDSDFGKENPDIVKSYYVRLVMCSLLWNMFRHSGYQSEIRTIMLEGLKKYSDLKASIKDAKIDRIKRIWCNLIIRKRFFEACVYVRLFEIFYITLRHLRRITK